MAKYNPNEDVPFGIAAADFPVTFYDRPSLMFANVLRGDIDGVTRAMLSPSTLSPSQIQSVRDLLIPGEKPNPFLKTIVDITTNPLVIMGLILGFWKFPMGSTKPLLAIRNGLLPKSATMSRMFSGLHDAMTNLRTIPDLYNSLWGVIRKTGEFMSKYGDDANNIFLNTGEVDKVGATLVAARLDGLHKAEHNLVKLFGAEPEWIAFMGKEKVPIAPNIQNFMSPKLIGLSDKLRNWFNQIRSELMANPQVKERLIKAVEKKGLRFGEDVVDYYPQFSQFNKYYQQSIRGTTGVQYRNWLHKAVGEKVGRELIARTGASIPDLAVIRIAEEAGAVKPGFASMLESILNRQTTEASQIISNIWDDILKVGGNETQQRLLFIERVKDYYTTGKGKALNFVGRLGSKKQAIDTLDAMAGALQQAGFKGPEGIQRELFEIGRVLANPPQYSYNLREMLGRYLNSVSSSYAWHGTGLGDKIMGIVRSPGVFREAPYLESYLMDNIIPHVQGLKSYQELQRSLTVSVQKEKIYNWIKASPYVETLLGKKSKDWLLGYFSKQPTALSAESISAQISHAFYLSTLGANLSPVTQNSLQNFLTTMNMQGIGLPGLWRGMVGIAGEEGLFQKLQKYISMYSAGTKDAFQKAFPEYVKDMGESSQIVESLLAGDIAREGYAVAIGPKGAFKKFSQALLFPFSTSEAFNRLWGYYSGRYSHLFHNAAKLATASAEVRNQIFEEAGKVGTTVTLMAHFPGGPLGVPKAIMNLPSPLRQFMHFPLRYMGFLHASLRAGGDPNKLDWGTIGRALAGSTGIYLGARNLFGENLAPSLLAGALPVPTYEKAPFYPWPLVPPIVGVAGMLGKAALSGSAEDLGTAVSLLVPGGIAARRVYKNLSPKYADYQNKTSDGRIPIYNKDQALIGTLTPMQLVLRSLGLRSMNIAAEQGAAKWILAQRDRVRGYKREYLQALYENDNRKAEQINAEFQRVYPELGPLSVKQSDIRAFENRREVTRLNRILRGIPSAYQPIFQQIIGEATLGTTLEQMKTEELGLLPQYMQQNPALIGLSAR